MSGGPPIGQPWCANVGDNPNINRDPGPPPPLNVVSNIAPASATTTNQVFVEHQQAPIYSPSIPIGIGNFPYGLPPFGADIGLGMIPPVPFMDPFMYGGGGLLAPIRTGELLPDDYMCYRTDKLR
jgi:hypothetical protein